ncbi:hypothetical protein CEXT_262411 [Caerostris extrusa]|uniref:Uncharacterized protein n=1 Tax=Caerostris extrusa TaxID=172846 RepID=A0AAV4QES2_CAEEX|nr:hypothetical protein CEXT_262411 [Caerostris extrusa]
MNDPLKSDFGFFKPVKYGSGKVGFELNKLGSTNSGPRATVCRTSTLTSSDTYKSRYTTCTHLGVLPLMQYNF